MIDPSRRMWFGADVGRLPYLIDLSAPVDVASALRRISTLSRPFCLDATGRYTFLGHSPVATFHSQMGFVTRTDGDTSHTQIDTPLSALHRFAKILEDLPSDPYLPFYGGLVGYVSFEWGTQSGPHAAEDLAALPDTWFGLYDTVLVVDHAESTAYIASLGLDAAMQPRIDLAVQRAEALAEQVSAKASSVVGIQYSETTGDRRLATDDDLAPVSPRRRYREIARELKQHLWQGVAEKVNLSSRYVGLLPTDPSIIHAHLREQNPAPYAMYIDPGPFQLCSTSPTCFLSLHDGILTARPVLGHRARSILAHTPDAQAFLAEVPEATGLLHRLCEELRPLTTEGRVMQEVPRVEADARAFHLTCGLQAPLHNDRTILDALATIVPGLSMTGFPKPTALQLLAHYEPFRRHAYTGAMGYLAPNGRAQFNLSVRLLTIRDGLGYLHAANWLDARTNIDDALDQTDARVAAFFSRLHDTPITAIHEQSCY